MVTKPLFIYVASAMTARGQSIHEAPRITHQNLRKGMLVGMELIKKGHSVFSPQAHYFMYLESDTQIPAERWYQIDNEILSRCDALFLVNHSIGADRELELAKSLGLKIFYSLDEVPTAEIPEYSTKFDN